MFAMNTSALYTEAGISGQVLELAYLITSANKEQNFCHHLPFILCFGDYKESRG